MSKNDAFNSEDLNHYFHVESKPSPEIIRSDSGDSNADVSPIGRQKLAWTPNSECEITNNSARIYSDCNENIPVVHISDEDTDHKGLHVDLCTGHPCFCKHCELFLNREKLSSHSELTASQSSFQLDGDDDVETWSPIETLPDELMLIIFSYLDQSDLYLRLSLVNKHLSSLAQDSLLRTKLRVVLKPSVSNEMICGIIKRSGHLMALDLDVELGRDASDVLQSVSESCPKMTLLTFRFGVVNGVHILVDLVKNCKQIEFLDLEGSNFPSSVHHFEQMHLVRHLNLSHCQFIEDGNVLTIAKQCYHLQYLNIDGITNIHDLSVVCLLQMRAASLTHLLLDGELLTDVSYLNLYSCRQLIELGVSFCDHMTDSGLNGIRKLPKLAYLKLRKGVQLTADGITSLFSTEFMTNLMHLNLGECSQLNDSCMVAIASSCPKLTQLVLHWCWEVTDVGLAAVVAACPLMRILDLVGMVQLTGSSWLLNLLTQMPDLLVLDMEQCCAVKDELLVELCVARPALKIFDHWGDLVVATSPSCNIIDEVDDVSASSDDVESEALLNKPLAQLEAENDDNLE